MNDSIPERVSASRATGTRGDSEVEEERFGREENRARKAEREAAARAESQRVDVVEEAPKRRKAPPPATTP